MLSKHIPDFIKEYMKKQRIQKIYGGGETRL